MIRICMSITLKDVAIQMFKHMCLSEYMMQPPSWYLETLIQGIHLQINNTTGISHNKPQAFSI